MSSVCSWIWREEMFAHVTYFRVGHGSDPSTGRVGSGRVGSGRVRSQNSTSLVGRVKKIGPTSNSDLLSNMCEHFFTPCSETNRRHCLRLYIITCRWLKSSTRRWRSTTNFATRSTTSAVNVTCSISCIDESCTSCTSVRNRKLMSCSLQLRHSNTGKMWCMHSNYTSMGACDDNYSHRR